MANGLRIKASLALELDMSLSLSFSFYTLSHVECTFDNKKKCIATTIKQMFQMLLVKHTHSLSLSSLSLSLTHTYYKA